MAAWQFHRFANGGLVGAATLVDLFNAVDAHHLGRRQLGHFRPGGGFLASVAQPALDFDLEAAGAGEGQQDNGVDPLLLGFRQAVVDGRQNVGAEGVAGQDETLGAPLLPIVLHQFGEVGGALLRGLVLPVVAQGVDTHHRITELGHFPGHVAVQVAPAAIAREEQGHGVLGLAGRDFHHGNVQAAVVRAHQQLAQFVVQHLGQVDVVVADAGGGIGGVAYEAGAFVIRVVVPGHQPMAMAHGLGQRVGAAGRRVDGEAHRYRLGLVVVLRGDPAPGQGGTRADAADQGRGPGQLWQGVLQGLFLQLAVVLGQDHLDNLRCAAAAQGQQLLVAQGRIRQYGDHHAGLGLGAGGYTGQGRAIGLGQLLQDRLGRGAIPPPIATTCDQCQHHQGGQQVPPSTSNHQRFTNPVRPPAIRAAVSASATSGSSPAGTAM